MTFGIAPFSGTPFASLEGGASVTVALTGVSSTGAVGSVTPSRTVALTGVGASGAVGTVNFAFPIDITGVVA